MAKELEWSGSSGFYSAEGPFGVDYSVERRSDGSWEPSIDGGRFMGKPRLPTCKAAQAACVAHLEAELIAWLPAPIPHPARDVD